jgi:hypothetical protein
VTVRGLATVTRDKRTSIRNFGPTVLKMQDSEISTLTVSIIRLS